MPLNRLIDSGQPISPPPDVQRTTFGIDVLSRFVCSTWTEATTNAPFDVVVIGAGMFGGYCAEKVYRYSKLKVLVLDAGAFLIPTHLQNLPNIGLKVPGAINPRDANSARELVWGIPWRSNVDFVGQPYCLGGKSLYWGGWCPRLLPEDLDAWPGEVADYLNEYYGDLKREIAADQHTIFIQGTLFDLLKQRISKAAVANLHDVQDPPLAVQGQSPAPGVFAFDKYSSLPALIDAARDAANQPDNRRRLFIVPNAHVTRLNTAGGFVSSLDVFVDGTIKSLPVAQGCSVVLALGTIESTRLALVSFPGSPNDPAKELMGRNLMSHWRSNVTVRIKRSAFDPDDVLPKDLETAALLIRGSTGLGKFQIQVTASADPSGNSDRLLFTMIPDIELLDSILKNQHADWISITFRGSSQLIGDPKTSVPNASGRWINLSPFENDEFGIPRAYVHYTTTHAEDDLAADMEKSILDLARQLAGDNPADLQVVSNVRDGLGTTYHEAGTLWMGTDVETSVTNPDGRFHHVENAFCADQSLFVTVGSVNPTLTGLVLARKVAGAVMKRATGKDPIPKLRAGEDGLGRLKPADGYTG
jgi:choline dehydrogenase-like flavoprotein